MARDYNDETFGNAVRHVFEQELRCKLTAVFANEAEKMIGPMVEKIISELNPIIVARRDTFLDSVVLDFRLNGVRVLQKTEATGG